MNALASLNLASHDQGVAAISNFPLALDWLAIPVTPPSLTHPHHQPLHQPLHYPTPITHKQAASSLVRIIQPYACREVLAPCFRVASRFILGRTLGNLFVPSELSLPLLPSDRHPDSRFVLDLHHGSIVEVRNYPASRILLCIAYASRSAEYIALPPAHFARVEITYRRDPSPDTSYHQPPVSSSQHPPLPPIGSLFNTQSSATRLALPAASWHHFCTNYAAVLPTGPLVATVSAEPGPPTPTVKAEAIFVSLNDQLPMTFSHTYPAARTGGIHARRLAPKRLLPRPSP